MSLLHGVFFGMGMLILVYLGVKNSSGVVAIFNSAGTQASAVSKTLQGR